MCVFLLLSSRLRLSSVSVVFDFSDSLSDVAPAYAIPFPVDEIRKETMNCRWMSFVYFLLSSPLRSSTVIVVFDFSDSLNDVTPVSPMLSPVHVMRKRKE